MVLMKIGDFDPQYKDTFGGYDIKGLSVYADVDDDKVGSVHDLLVDENGRFRYLVVDLGFWGFGKKILLPVGRSRVDSNSERVYTVGFTKEQAKQLPEFGDNLKIDTAYEALVHGVYQPGRAMQSSPQPMGTRGSNRQERGVDPQRSRNDSFGTPPYPQGTPQTPVAGQQPVQRSVDYPAAAAPQPGYGQQPNQGFPPQQPNAPGNAHGQVPGHSAAPSYAQQPDPGVQSYDQRQDVQQNYAGYANQGAAPGSMPNGGYDYRQDPDLYEMNPQNHGLLQRYEERLIQHARQSRVRR